MFGEVTKNGPEVPSVTVNAWKVVLPPSRLLSLTVNLKFKVLATLGKTSQVGVILSTIAARFGNVLEGSVVGMIDLKIGPPVLVETGGCVKVPSLLYCSHV